FDFLGFALCGIGLAAAALALEYAGRHLISDAAESGLIVLAASTLALYGLYAKRKPSPAVDLKIFRIKTFRIGVVGGMVCRIGLGSTAFLLPLLLQIPLGLSAFKSGLITSILSIGALALKTVSPPLFRALGFRRILLTNTAILGLLMGCLAFITPRTSHLVLFGLLLLIGFFRSLQYTSMNTLSYSDAAGPEISSATSVASVVQQLAASFGVAISATLLAQVAGPGGIPTNGNFLPVFITMAMFPIASLLWFAQLTMTDGAHVSGHRVTRQA
ncbi:MAG: MFS transporter, partial [Alphaproteobacteria bacterium]|nr:MFS transporter [Alphaproteobacteria bacterium]